MMEAYASVKDRQCGFSSSLRCWQYPRSQEIELGAPIHGAFDQFRSVDLPFGLIGALFQRQTGFYGS
jgi:hypothetical protein